MSPRPTSGLPAAADVPGPVRELAAGESIRPVWRNELDGLTFELGGRERRFVKWNPRGSDLDLAAEAARLAWVGSRTPVPTVLATGEDDDATWLVTAALPGENAVTERWRAEPAMAVRAIGEALRALHEALPVDGCPFSWSDAERTQAAKDRAAVGELERARWWPEHRHLGWEDVLARLADPPPADRLVVCHGDACAPNTLLTDDGRWSGHVDLGALGVADRWADLAVACWSTEWNYGPGWTAPLLAAYGTDDEPERRAFYRLLWDAS